MKTNINARIEIVGVLDNLKKVFRVMGDKELAKEVANLTANVMAKNLTEFLSMEYVKEGEKKI